MSRAENFKNKEYKVLTILDNVFNVRIKLLNK